MPSWGAKRVRTALGAIGSSSRRDWASLANGPAGLIAERVLANDVADYLRFRAVCRTWRGCCDDPRAHGGLDPRFHPRRWIMLREELASPYRCRVLNSSTGECIQVDLPELRGHHMAARTYEGFLLLVHEDTHVLRLLNPLTRALADFPPVTPLLRLHDDDDDNSTFYDASELFTYSDFGIAADDDDSTTVVLCLDMDTVLVAKPGDACWKKVAAQNVRPIRTTTTVGGRFCCVDGVNVMALRPSAAGGGDQPPRLEVVAELHRRVSEMMDTPHLVDNGGELLMVHRRFRRGVEAGDNDMRRGYDVYRVDLDDGRVLPVTSFGGRAVFLGQSYSISVPADAFPSIRGDTIYLSFDLNERLSREKIEAYHLADGSTTPSSSVLCDDDGSLVQPHSVADCLALSVDCHGVVT